MSILVYNGPGSKQDQVAAISQFLKSNHFNVKPADGDYLRSESWEEDTSAVVFTSGSSTDISRGLHDEGLEKIRKYVENGGKFWGFGGSSYLASEICRFKDWSPRIRPLSLMHGSAIGPIRPFDGDAQSDDAASAEMIHLVHSRSSSPTPADGLGYSQAAPYFVPIDSVKVLATYSAEGEFKDKPAIVQCSLDRGVAVLSGLCLHMPFDMAPENVRDALRNQEQFRKKVLSQMIIALDLRV